MIRRDEIKPIGYIVKTHGINGEVNVSWDIPDLEPEQLRCLIFDIDGIYVPFFIRSCRRRGADSHLLAFDGIDDDRAAADIAGHSVYALSSDIDAMYGDDHSGAGDDGFYADDLIGFTVIANGATAGTIDDYDDSTDNVLFVVATPDNRKILIPVADEFVIAIDPELHTIEMDIPSDLLTLNP